MPSGKVRSTSGSREATTGLPIAAYSYTFVERVIAVNRSSRVGASPMSAAATAAGTSSIGMRPWNVTRSAMPSSAASARSSSSESPRPYRSKRTSRSGRCAATRATARSVTSSSYVGVSAPV